MVGKPARMGLWLALAFAAFQRGQRMQRDTHGLV